MKHNLTVKIFSVLFLATCLNTYTMEDTPENPFAEFNEIAQKIDTSGLNFQCKGMEAFFNCKNYWNYLIETQIPKKCRNSSDTSCIKKTLKNKANFMSSWKNNTIEQSKCCKNTIQAIETSHRNKPSKR